jgi:hypothetical protein
MVLKRFLILVALCSVFARAASSETQRSSTLNGQSHLLPATEQELARARQGTAKYHDIAQAEADGYVDIGLYLPGEGFHWVKPAIIDGVFDPSQPEVLLYAPVPGESRLQLVGVEYLVPLSLSPNPPAGFTGADDQWRMDSEGFGFWEVNAWIWLNNPEGIFGHDNPRIP